MKTTITNLLSKVMGQLISKLAVYTVNSTCLVGLGQEPEPDTLSKYKNVE